MALRNLHKTLFAFFALACFMSPQNLLVQDNFKFVQGFSTSFHWPHLLKNKLDRHFGDHKIEIKRATRGSTPIAKWMDSETGERKKNLNRHHPTRYRRQRRSVGYRPGPTVFAMGFWRTKRRTWRAKRRH